MNAKNELVGLFFFVFRFPAKWEWSEMIRGRQLGIPPGRKDVQEKAGGEQDLVGGMESGVWLVPMGRLQRIRELSRGNRADRGV